MIFNSDLKTLQISPSDIATFDWSPDEFYRKCILKERDPDHPVPLWGSLHHAIIQAGAEGEEMLEKFPLERGWKDHLRDNIYALSKGNYQYEIPILKEIDVDDWTVTISYRLDAIDYSSGKVLEFKFPQTPWTQYKANSDLKTMCYLMFHSDIEIWCTTVENGFEKFTVKTDREKAEEKVKEILRVIIGHLQNSYFYKQ